ncbi:MAG: ABC transporter permease subunit [Ruminiclostridium sp.]|nr:ABC transporter permease subunit [Ruminiclostridium sp.]
MRKNTKKVDIIIIAVLILLLAGGILLALLSQNEPQTGDPAAADTNGDGKVTAVDYIGKKLGIITGTDFEAPTMENFPDSEYLYFNSYSDIGEALTEGKIDGFLGEEPTLRIMNSEQPQIGYLSEMITHDNYAFGFPKDSDRADDIRNKFNEMLESLEADGTLEEMKSKWFGADESKKTVDLTGFSGENGTLNVVTTSTDIPFSYIKDNQNIGYSIELVELFCRRYGYTPDIEDVDFSARIPGIVSGKYDMCASSLTVTEERRESVNFSEPVYNGGIVLAVRSEDIVSQNSIAAAAAPLSYFKDKRIGILTGSSFEPITLEKFPDGEYLYFNTYSDLNLALLEHRIDGYMSDEPTAIATHTGNGGISYLDEKVDTDSYYFVFGKTETRSQTLLKQFNDMLAGMEADGTLAELHKIWLGEDTSKQMIDRTGLTGENGTVNVGTCSFAPPFNMIVNGELSGLAIDLSYRFAREYGYKLNFQDTDINGMLSGLAGGKYDMLASPFSKTPEREESADFSEPFYSANIRFVVRTEDVSSPKTEEKASLSDFNGKTAGVITGSMHDALINEKLPDSQRLEFKNYSDLTEALTANKIDYFLMSRDGLAGLMAENDRIGFIEEPLDTLDVGAIFAKTAEAGKIREQFDEFITKAKANGTIESIYEYWRSSGSDGKSVDMSGLAGENGTLVFATTGDKPPITFVANGSIAGADPDIAVHFCREYGYDIKVEIVDGGGLIPGVISGIYDFAMADFVITDERKESVDFSIPYSDIELFVTARKEDTVNAIVNDEDKSASDVTGFLESIASSFEKNFIREERWKLITEGIGTTCLITSLSALFGTALAFLICMFRRTGSRLANAISNIYVKLLQGTPIVVLLMILYYVILGKSGLEAVWVAVIGFSLNFGAYASEIMRSGIESIDGGQREAALALGYSENKAFFKFIFPQAAVRFIPVYKQEIVSLLKSTSIVGYIAIQDLTKMSDIIRSRTYEAFFPLIATAMIYFILAWIISLLLKIIMNAIDRKHRREGAAK